MDSSWNVLVYCSPTIERQTSPTLRERRPPSPHTTKLCRLSRHQLPITSQRSLVLTAFNALEARSSVLGPEYPKNKHSTYLFCRPHLTKTLRRTDVHFWSISASNQFLPPFRISRMYFHRSNGCHTVLLQMRIPWIDNDSCTVLVN